MKKGALLAFHEEKITPRASIRIFKLLNLTAMKVF
jgi:hypothetical protein